MKKFFTLKRMVFLMVFISLHTQSIGQKNSQELGLHQAILSGNLSKVKKSYTTRSAIQIEPSSGLRALHLACKRGDRAIVDFLLDKELEMEGGVYVSRNEMPPMIHAIQNGHLDIVRLLFEKGRRHPNGNWMGKTYLFHALYHKASPAIVELLLGYGASMSQAKSQLPIDATLSKNKKLAEKWTSEIAQSITLNEYQKIDVWNLSVRSSNMLFDIAKKYGKNSQKYQSEAKEIADYRKRKLKWIVDRKQFSKIGELSLF